MKKEYCKAIGLIILVAVIICTIAYAGECSKKETLPSAALAVVQEMYPHREMAKIEAEEEALELYEVDFADGGSMVISAEGMVVSIETVEGMQSIPLAVAGSISQSVQGANIQEVEKEVIYAVIKLVKLETPKTIYEAKMNKDGQEVKIKVSSDGTLLSREVEDDDDDEGDDDEDEDDEGDDDEDDEDEDDEDDEDEDDEDDEDEDDEDDDDEDDEDEDD